ncbi:RNA polymerase sigma-70 factor (ECF subfamily) [Caulobacter ginsengisoli]|uniref:RNA polymerase sigma-70 factor (ECF subfamily) n=1 Tax=Caulobacter ginsengisoli TaxID=400775 RepID=A0ABU0IQM7_9CAUL|nr:RNA polymerase sigma factor [Caulobacter ginsengisoli]MDQ0464316.1 RNA polymerase sigma-70 factor (ECF subfamily) [Caulobacter ginsengisoli]
MSPPEVSNAARTLLVARAQSGNRAALDELLRQHQQALFLHARTITGNRDDAFDALQDALLLIARRLGGLRDPRWFRAWAYRITTREAVRRLKGERRLQMLREDESKAVNIAPDPGDGRLDQAMALAEAQLAKLSPAAQVAMRLHYLDSLSFVEISEALELPIGTVKSRVSDGLRQLRLAMSGAADPG